MWPFVVGLVTARLWLNPLTSWELRLICAVRCCCCCGGPGGSVGVVKPNSPSEGGGMISPGLKLSEEKVLRVGKVIACDALTAAGVGWKLPWW